MILSGIDAANPLGYLAALGAFRLLSETGANVQMRWVPDGVWRAELIGVEEQNEASICEELLKAPRAPAEAFIELIANKNITVDGVTFSKLSTEAGQSALLEDRRAADFAAAFGSEVCEDAKKGRIEHTSFCFITGSGHQDFLDTMRALGEKTSASDLRRALFMRWNYPDKGCSMRWDPGEAREYALRWKNPGPEGAWTEWGANRLAIEALPLFPSFPVGRHLETTGFREAKPWEEFTWPVWQEAVTCDTVRSLVSLAELQNDQPNRKLLGAVGISEVYRAQRIRIGAGANFKVSFRPARSV
jgi:hypothetical protein